MRKLYVGNLPYSVNSDALRARFAEHGTVDTLSLITDRDSGQCRGFGFVEMSTEAEARAAISGLDGADFEGHALKVNEAKPAAKRGGGGGGRGRDGRGR